MNEKLLIIVLLFLASSCYIGDEVAPDQEIWEYSLPEQQGLSNQGLLIVNNQIQSNLYQEVDGLIVIRNDKLIFENYYSRIADSQGFVRREPTLTKRFLPVRLGSGGLTFTLAAIGIAQDKRFLSIEDPIANYLPEYADIFSEDPTKAEVTIEHLLLHRGGFSWNELTQTLSPQNDLTQMKLTNDWIRFILEKPLEAPPGLRYNFNSASGLILSKIIENASEQDFEIFLEENLLNPLTISTLEYEIDPQGNLNAGEGISVSLLDWTKLGYLFLNNGSWQGRRIMNPNFVADATSSLRTISGTTETGYFWQRFGDDFTGFFGIDHEEIFYSRGETGQHIYIIPSENMIVSIFAQNFFFGLVNPSLNLFDEITNTFQ